ncbi:MAG: ABC transporter permease [Bradymonadales bacterium]|nr:ABC transporter permease [Bradymonadales bacterium]
MRISGLVIKNLARHRRSFAFAMVGIVLGVSSFIVFLALGQGLRQNVLQRVFVVDQLEVVPRRYHLGAFETSGGLFAGGTGLDDYTVEDLREIPGVLAVYPKMQLSFPSIMKGGEQFFGQTLMTELIAEGLPADLVSQDLPPPEHPYDAFMDWDGDGFSCASPGAAGTGEAVGCPPGRRCNEQGECEQMPCNPSEEVLAAPNHRLATLAQEYLATRLPPQRYQFAIRELPAELLPPDQPLPFRLTVAELHRDRARELLPDFLAVQSAMRHAHYAVDLTRQTHRAQIERRGARRLPIPVVDVVLLTGNDGVCSDPPSYCAEDTRRCEMPIPVVASPFLMEIYNTSIQNVLSGSTRSMPRVTPEALVGFTFWGEMGRGFLGRSERVEEIGIVSRKFRLVGWSVRAIRLGVSIPLEYVRRYNMLYRGEQVSDEYHSILVVAEKSADLARIAMVVQDDLNLSIDAAYEQAKRGSLMITLLTLGLLLISLLIIGLASLNITHTFLMVVTERRKEIGVLRAVGARRWHIKTVVLTEAVVIGLVGSALAVGLALAVAALADGVLGRYVPDFPFKPDSLFAFHPLIIAAGAGVGLLFSLIGAYLPASRASRLDPAVTLRAE